MTDATQESIYRLVRELIPQTLDSLLAKLEQGQSSPSAIRAWSIDLPQKAQRETLASFVGIWKADHCQPTAEIVAAVIRAQRFLHQRQTRAEVCWSGPIDSLQGFRSTAAAFAELMNSAERSILILTYSTSEVDQLRGVLEDAVRRGIAVRLICETFDVFNQVTVEGRLASFGEAVLEAADVFLWPHDRRRTSGGRVFGSMHVKCLLVDSESMLLTSANWSAAAMQDNMELGVVIRDQELVGSVVDHFDQLISSGELIRR